MPDSSGPASTFAPLQGGSDAAGTVRKGMETLEAGASTGTGQDDL